MNLEISVMGLQSIYIQHKLPCLGFSFPRMCKSYFAACLSSLPVLRLSEGRCSVCKNSVKSWLHAMEPEVPPPFHLKESIERRLADLHIFAQADTRLPKK
jgi:hypothetical protein